MDKIPVKVDATFFILSLSNNFANPIIQIYFRRDLRNSIKRMFRVFRASSRKTLYRLPKENSSANEEIRGKQLQVQSDNYCSISECRVSSLSNVDPEIVYELEFKQITAAAKEQKEDDSRVSINRNIKGPSASSLALSLAFSNYSKDTNTKVGGKLAADYISVQID